MKIIITILVLLLIIPVTSKAETVLLSLKSQCLNNSDVSVYINNKEVYGFQEEYFISLSPIFYAVDNTGKEYYVFQDNPEGNMCDGADLRIFERENNKFTYMDTIEWCAPGYPEISFNNTTKEITVKGEIISRYPEGLKFPLIYVYKNGEVKTIKGYE